MPFVRRHRDYYKYGTELNATVVGSFAKIDKGVASGFSASQYLVYPIAFTPDTQTWERVFKYITGSTVTDGTIYSNGTVDKCGDSLFIYGNKPRLLVGYTASAWNVDSTANYTLSPNTSYWFKISFTGTSYNMDVSTNGTDYENIISVASSTVITTNMSQLNIGQRLGYSSPLTSGSIDLSQSYININGERWWSGDSYTKVGSWIDDGVVSGFSSANYLQIAMPDFSKADNWETIFKINLSSTSSEVRQIFASSKSNPAVTMSIMPSNQVGLATGDGSSWNITESTAHGNTVLELNKDYWVKLEFTGSEYILWLSTDGEVYNTEYTYTSSAKIPYSSSYNFNIGVNRDGKYYPLSGGSIDLTQSYIKINGQDWWHGTKAVESTSSDYDYYVDRNKLYNLTRRLQRDYYKNWTQPVNPTGITTSGWTNATQAFDGVNDTYAYTTSNSAYIEYDFGQELYVTGFDAVGQWVNGIAHDSALDIYSVDKDGVETLIKAGTAGSDSANYPTSAKFPAVKTSKVRFKAHDTLGYQVRIREITVNGYADGTKDDYDYYTDRNKLYTLTGIKRYYWKYVTEAFDFVRTGTRSSSGWQSVSQAANYLSGGSNAYEMGQNRYTELLWTYVNTIPATTYTFNIETTGQGNGYFHNPTVTVTYDDSTTEVVYTKSWSGVKFNEDFTFVASKPIKAIKATGTLSHSSLSNVGIYLTLTSLTHIGSQKTTVDDYDHYIDKYITY